ncbi:MAG: hypothetical protein WD572_06100 [Gammaproteobacteria bacterium]
MTAAVQFNTLLRAPEEELLKTFYEFRSLTVKGKKKAGQIALKLGLNNGQLMCAVGFNHHAESLTDVVALLGFERFAEIEERRNEYFSKDIYRRLNLDNVLAIYGAIKDNPDQLQSMQYLLRRRLQSIENQIESTVNSLTIEKYKAEIRAIYADGIAGIDFAEERLNQMDSGFRALVNEVSMIVESRLIPVGEIFFMDTILPAEKRRLLERGLIPIELVESRFDSGKASTAEQKVLHEYLQQQRDQDNNI